MKQTDGIRGNNEEIIYRLRKKSHVDVFILIS